MLRAILQSKDMSLYKLERMSGISHATLNDLYNEVSKIDNCTMVTIYKLSVALDMDMTKLYLRLKYDDLSIFAFNKDFDLFKSNICQELKNIGDYPFITKYLTNKEIINLFNNKKYVESLYLLSLLDTLLEEHNLPLPKEYDDIRSYKLNRIYVSESIYLLLKKKLITVTEIFKECLPVFLTHNIIEAKIRDVA